MIDLIGVKKPGTFSELRARPRETWNLLRASSSPQRLGLDPRITITASDIQKLRNKRPDKRPHSITRS
jgi:hypothetical protein